jgi:hypothetical protein
VYHTLTLPLLSFCLSYCSAILRVHPPSDTEGQGVLSAGVLALPVDEECMVCLKQKQRRTATAEVLFA